MNSLVISLKQKDALLDVLSYDRVRIAGRALLSHVAKTFDIELPLGKIAKILDLRRVNALIIESAEQEVELRIDNFTFERDVRRRPKTPQRGFWVWEYRRALAEMQSIFDLCGKLGAHRVFIQIPSLRDVMEIWHDYVLFIKEAKKALRVLSCNRQSCQRISYLVAKLLDLQTVPLRR